MHPAVEHERLVREVACLELPERIGPFTVRPLTLRHYTALAVMNSPFLFTRRVPTLLDAAALLWLLAYDYQPGNSPRTRRARRKFLKPLADMRPPMSPLWQSYRNIRRHNHRTARKLRAQLRLLIAVRAYVDEAMQDAPPQGEPSALPKPSYYCDAAGICAGLARAFGGGPQMYLDLPLKYVFQLMKQQREYVCASNGEPAVLFNPSDKLVDAELVELNRELRRQGRVMHPAAQQYLRN